MKRTVFVLLGVIGGRASIGAYSHDNSDINSYVQYPGAGGTPESKFMSDAFQRHGPGTPDDNFMQDTTMREDSDSYLDDQKDWGRRDGGSMYQDENDQDDP